ncbi:hypothetical protein HMI54_010807, partial [Coelomomyces lativittatus]
MESRFGDVLPPFCSSTPLGRSLILFSFEICFCGLMERVSERFSVFMLSMFVFKFIFFYILNCSSSFTFMPKVKSPSVSPLGTFLFFLQQNQKKCVRNGLNMKENGWGKGVVLVFQLSSLSINHFIHE